MEAIFVAAMLYEAADPDYLVLGPLSFGWHVYAAVLHTGAFRLVLDQGNYQVYQRVR